MRGLRLEIGHHHSTYRHISVRKLSQNNKLIIKVISLYVPNSVAIRSKAWVCGCSFAELRVRIPPGYGYFSTLNFMCCAGPVSVL